MFVLCSSPTHISPVALLACVAVLACMAYVQTIKQEEAEAKKDEEDASWGYQEECPDIGLFDLTWLDDPEEPAPTPAAPATVPAQAPPVSIHIHMAAPAHPASPVSPADEPK